LDRAVFRSVLVLKTKFVTGLNKARAKAQDPATITYWFELYKPIILRYNISNDENVHNIDKKGALLGIISKVKVIVLRHKKKKYITEPMNRK
jgi:hypothetical protein